MSLFLFDLFVVGKPSFVVDNTIHFSTFFSHTSGYRILIDLFLFSMCGGAYTVPLYTSIQKLSDSKDRSMVIAGNNILNALFMVVASILLIVLLGLSISVPKLFLIYSILNLLVSFIIYKNISDYFWRFFCVCLLKILYRVEIVGEENIPEDGPIIITANHISFIDWLFLAAAVNKPVRFVMHYEFMKIPLLSIFFKGSKVIPIAGKKEDEQIMNQAFESIHHELLKKSIVCIFPEGEITKTGKLTYFRPGIEKTIARTPVDVIPFAITGLWGSFFSRKYGKAMSKPSVLFTNLRPRIVINVGEKINTEDVTSKNLELITQNLLDKNRL
jgi:1-acyl-sn-glycerol-3-phosphate acyltransferase